MKKEDLIIKWLDNSLDENELRAFEELNASSSLKKLDDALQQFKAPAFDTEAQYQKLLAAKSQEKTSFPWKKLIASIAAVLVIGLGAYFSFFSNQDATFFAQNSQKLELDLPDASRVILNAGSQISFDETQWEKNRSVSLIGEAFFDVKKGSTFTVYTPQGAITVLGTEFDVKTRDHYFEVFCYEGLVSVNYQNTNVKLPAGKGFRAFHNQTFEETTLLSKPKWLDNSSSFKSAPFSEIVDELQRQYDVAITYDPALKDQLLTTTFSHKNLEAALQAITIPLKLYYQIDGTKVMLKSEK